MSISPVERNGMFGVRGMIPMTEVCCSVLVVELTAACCVHCPASERRLMLARLNPRVGAGEAHRKSLLLQPSPRFARSIPGVVTPQWLLGKLLGGSRGEKGSTTVTSLSGPGLFNLMEKCGCGALRQGERKFLDCH